VCGGEEGSDEWGGRRVRDLIVGKVHFINQCWHEKS